MKHETHHPPEHDHPDWAKIARLEYELYDQTFHHVAPGCNCDECMKRRAEWDRQLHEQTAQGWQLHPSP